jgi:hypothetical protein
LKNVSWRLQDAARRVAESCITQRNAAAQPKLPKGPDMDEDAFTAVTRSFYAQPGAALRVACRRSAEHAARESRNPVEPAPRRRFGSTLRSLRAAAVLVAVCSASVGAAVLIASAAQAQAPAARSQTLDIAQIRGQRYAEAVQAFMAQRYADAYGRFTTLADAGHAPSALMALAMVRHGASMFGSDWSATPGQLQRWSAMAKSDLRQNQVRITEHERGE